MKKSPKDRKIPSNPAARAYAVFQHLPTAVGEKTYGDDEHDIWRKTFSLAGFGKLNDLKLGIHKHFLWDQLLAAKDMAEKKFIGKQLEKKVECFPQLKHAVWATKLSRLKVTKKTLSGLEHLAFDLDNEPEMAESELINLLNNVDSLVSEIRDSNLNDKVKQSFINTLLRIKTTIDQIRFAGPKALRDIIVELYSDESFQHNMEEIQKEAPTVYENIVTNLKKMNEYVKVGDMLINISHFSSKLLGIAISPIKGYLEQRAN